MFNLRANSNRCTTCGGSGRLRVAVLNRRGEVHKNLSDVGCEACNGVGEFMTAARYSAQNYGQQGRDNA